MEIRDAIVQLARIDQGLVTVQEVILRRTVSFGVEQARKRSSGPFSLYELAEMDHPYAVRHGMPLLDPSIINEQTGRFKASWQGEIGVSSGRVSNASDVADYLDQGTDTMFRRPIGDALEAEMEGFAEADAIEQVRRIVAN